jgi:hypothetical protein
MNYQYQKSEYYDDGDMFYQSEDDEDDNYDQSVVDKVYDTYYNVLAEHIQGNYSDEIYKLYRKNKK